ncbi:MAG: hypothetical protein II702_07615 [Clostridia bacterium]|jgi:energy-coupling factor transporter ATP-binding protein EcfA2|nr:hypothetical protein [Clostridia bacterium]MBQ4244763.1 hypothetical protein [Clostridia bacterium]
MISLIIGHKGSGKTKTLISCVNSAVESSDGNVVCVEKERLLTYDIDSRARLVETDQYKVSGYTALYGFLAGMFAGNYDITDMFVDATLRIGGRDFDELCAFLKRINYLSDEARVNCTFTISADAEELPEEIFTFCKKI